MIKFNKNYFILFSLIFIIEISIAKYATGFIRHSVGDYFAVLFVYTFIKSIFKISIEKAVLITFIISFVIEFLQLTNLQNHFPFRFEKIFKIVLGTSFSIGDLVAYSLGIISIIIIEKNITKN